MHSKCCTKKIKKIIRIIFLIYAMQYLLLNSFNCQILYVIKILSKQICVYKKMLSVLTKKYKIKPI